MEILSEQQKSKLNIKISSKIDKFELFSILTTVFFLQVNSPMASLELILTKR